MKGGRTWHRAAQPGRLLHGRCWRWRPARLGRLRRWHLAL